MPTVTSADGTAIGYERSGDGPAVVLVDGALCHRAGGPMRPLAALLRERFTVYAYDRRGRGDSSDTPPYSVDREIEDLRAVIAEAGGRACAYGISSGAALALRAAAAGTGITRLALYEPPFMAEIADDDTQVKEYSARLDELLAAGRRGDAVALFLATVGVPAPVVAGMRGQPAWAALEAVAPTLGYDDRVLNGGRVPREPLAVPVLVLSGGASPAPLREAARATAAAVPGAGHRVLDGQTHDVAPDAIAPVLVEFFNAGARSDT